MDKHPKKFGDQEKKVTNLGVKRSSHDLENHL